MRGMRAGLARRVWPALLALCALVAPGCASPSVMDPHGGRADRIATLWWIMLGISAVVFVVVVGLLLVAAGRSWRRRRTDPAVVGTEDNDLRLIVGGGIIVPGIVLIALFAFTLHDMSAITAPHDPAPLTIEVTGHQWWWEIHYPGQAIITANELHIPVGQQVHIEVDSPDVIHSFWVPQLQGKIDTIPGQTNETWIEADQPGTYRGQCAEFCGLQHANMALDVVAEAPDAFNAWVAREQQPAPQPADATLARGKQVFLGSACVYCHTIGGTDASGRVGPDLTHLASRQRLAAGTLPNAVGSLAGWILNPQSIKPGTQMPPTQLPSDDLQALLAYLETLK